MALHDSIEPPADINVHSAVYLLAYTSGPRICDFFPSYNTLFPALNSSLLYIEFETKSI